jgi:hypothetical protein
MSAAEPEPSKQAEPQPAPDARAVDPVHVAVLLACTLGLFAIGLHYFGVGR